MRIILSIAMTLALSACTGNAELSRDQAKDQINALFEQQPDTTKRHTIPLKIELGSYAESEMQEGHRAANAVIFAFTAASLDKFTERLNEIGKFKNSVDENILAGIWSLVQSGVIVEQTVQLKPTDGYYVGLNVPDGKVTEFYLEQKVSPDFVNQCRELPFNCNYLVVAKWEVSEVKSIVIDGDYRMVQYIARPILTDMAERVKVHIESDERSAVFVRSDTGWLLSR
jgi:hypothetical protein